MRISDSVAILLAYVFFCLGGQGVALAAEAAAPSVTAAGSEKREEPAGLQGDGIRTEATQNPGTILVVAGRVHFVAGDVRAGNEAGEVRTLQKGDSINVGDTVISASESSVQIRMEDGGLIALRSESQLKFDSFIFSGKEDGTEACFLTLSSGGFRASTGLIGRHNQQSYRITTPTAVIGIGNSDHVIVYLANDVPGALAGTYNRVNSGVNTLTTGMGTVNVEPGQMGYSGSMSQLPQLMPINPSLFSDASDARAGGFFPSLGTSLAAPPPPSETVTGKSAEAAKEKEVVEVAEPAGPMFVPAPIIWGGDVSESLHKQIYEQGQSSLQNVQTVNLRAWTYVWQPWLAQVNGGIGVVNAKNVSGVGSNNNASLNGRGTLSLVPYSRFPFLASYYATDSRAGSGEYATALDFGSNTNGFEVQQSYRPLSNSSNSVISYNHDRTTLIQPANSTRSPDQVNSHLHVQHDYRLPGSPSLFGIGYTRSTSSGDAQGSGVTTGLNANYSTSFNQHLLEVNSANTEGEFQQESSRYNYASMRHTYRPDRLLSVATSAYANQFKLLSPGQNSSNARNLQLDSITSWQPDEELPFYVFGRIRIFDTVYETPTTLLVSQSQIFGASVSYIATPNLKYDVHETLANTRSGGNSSRTTLTGGSVNYNSDITKLGNASHRWNANGGIDYQTDSASVPNKIFFGGAGQGLTMPSALDEGELVYNFDQSLSARDDGIFGQTGTLTHNGGVLWKPVLGASLSGAVNFTLTDVRTFGDRPADLQAANLSVNGLQRISVYSSMSAFASVEWTGNEHGQSASAVKVDLKYNHARAFNVKGLRYALTVNINKYQSDDARINVRSRNGYLIDQKLEYTIGRAYIRLNGTIIKNYNSKSTLIVLRLGRNFGEI